MRKRTLERHPDSKSMMCAAEAPKAVHPLARRLWGRIIAAKPAAEKAMCRPHCCAKADRESYMSLTGWIIFRSWCWHPNSQAGEERGVQNKALLPRPNKRRKQRQRGQNGRRTILKQYHLLVLRTKVTHELSGFQTGCASTNTHI